MTIRSSIKIIIAVLFIAGLSVALYLRQPKDKWEPNWDKGLISCSENAYYNNNIFAIIKKWAEAKEELNPDSDVFHQVWLVIDLDEKAIWLEKEGKIIKDYYIEFPPKVKFEIDHFSKKDLTLQTGRIILRNADDKTVQASSEQITLHSLGNSYMLNFSIIDTRKGAFRFKSGWPQGSIPTTMNVNDLDSPLIVTKEEYEKYLISSANKYTLHSDKGSTQSRIFTVLEENKAAWKKIEKKLFIEIEKQVHKAGYQLNKLDVSPEKDFNTSNAFVIGYNYNVVIKILDKNPYANTNLGIIHIRDNIWYVASKPEPKKKRNERQIKLEFLVYPDRDIFKEQEKEYIKQGREKFKEQYNSMD